MRHRIAIAVAFAAFCAHRPAVAAVDKFQITPEEHAACDADVVRLCAASFPDQDRVFACMKASLDQLTPVCLRALKSGMKRRNLKM